VPSGAGVRAGHAVLYPATKRAAVLLIETDSKSLIGPKLSLFDKMQFYLEALDRDVKKPHEQPSIGVLLCATKNNEVVEYALSRSMSPALVAQYQTQLPDKKLLQAKLHECYALAESHATADSPSGKMRPPAPALPAPAKRRKARRK
jgi:hypothetical protein